MENVRSWIFVTLLSIPVFTLNAAAADVGTVGELSRLQSATILLKAQAKREDARADLASKRLASGDGDGTLPVVKSILNNDLTFLYPSNVKVMAHVGDTIPGGYTVAKINDLSNKVELTKGKESFVVGFSGVAPVSKTEKPRGPAMPWQGSVAMPGQ